METAITAKTNVASVKSIVHVTETKTVSPFWQQMEFNRFGIIAIVLVIVACIGGIGAAVAVQKSVFLLALVASPAMAVEAFILSLMPMRTIIISSVISIFISLSVAIIF